MAKQLIVDSRQLVKWQVVPPHRRTILARGQLVRVAFSRPQVFMTRVSAPYDQGPRLNPGRRKFIELKTWQFQDADLKEDTQLYNSPFCVPTSSITHVTENGQICFDKQARDAIDNGRDPIDVFWMSGFSVLPTWLMQARRTGKLGISPVPRRTYDTDTSMIPNRQVYVGSHIIAPWTKEEEK